MQFPNKDRIGAIAIEHLRSIGAGEPQLLAVELVTLDPQRREMLAFMKSQKMTREERKKVLSTYRSLPRQEWSVLFHVFDPKYEGGRTSGTVKIDIRESVTKVDIIPRLRDGGWSEL
jgi:hypothetical protein